MRRGGCRRAESYLIAESGGKAVYCNRHGLQAAANVDDSTQSILAVAQALPAK